MGKGDVDSAAAKRWVDRVVAKGCIVCRNLGDGPTPGVYHHLRVTAGAGQKNGPCIGICLCPQHHTDGGPGVAYHAAPKTFERMYGSELDLLNQTIEELS